MSDELIDIFTLALNKQQFEAESFVGAMQQLQKRMTQIDHALQQMAMVVQQRDHEIQYSMEKIVNELDRKHREHL